MKILENISFMFHNIKAVAKLWQKANRVLFDVPISDPLRRNVLFRCCFRFSSSVGLKPKKDENIFRHKTFPLTFHVYFYQLVAHAAPWYGGLPFFPSFLVLFLRWLSFLCSDGAKVSKSLLSVFLWQCLKRFSFSPLTLPSPDIALRNIIKKSERWFIEKALSLEGGEASMAKTLWISIKICGKGGGGGGCWAANNWKKLIEGENFLSL